MSDIRANHESLSEVLVEAESFTDYGGWILDSQFENEMGSPYLLAHGLGQPVKDAKTTIVIHEVGEYRVWVRAKDWVPSHHPGRFTLSINEKELGTEFGANGLDWMWQFAGTVKLPQGNVMLALHDLTGFDGRCDAIFLTLKDTVPPEKADEAARTWRMGLLGFTDEPIDAGNFDLVVVGGGVAGCAATLTAARLGCRVALIHDRPFLGGNASIEIGLDPRGEKGALIEELTKRTPDGDLYAVKVLETEPNVTLFLEQSVCNAVMDRGRIISINTRYARNGRKSRFHAPVFIDCTGKAALGLLAGAETRFGRESRSEYNESLAPNKQDDMHHGNTLLFRTRMADKPVIFPDVPWALEVAKDYANLGGQLGKPGKENQVGPIAGKYKVHIVEQSTDEKSNAAPPTSPIVNHMIDAFQSVIPKGLIMKIPASHFWEYGQWLNPYTEGERIRDHLFRAIYGTFANVKHLDPKNYSNLALDWLAFVPAHGEYRRLVGDYILNENDIRTHKDFSDAVVLNSEAFCLHYPGHKKYDFRLKDWKWIVRDGRPYSIPFRCLFSANVSNLMMAGKHISVTHIAGSSTKMMGNGGQHGIAVGAAAFLCKKHNETCRGIYESHIMELQNTIKEIVG
jgi:hypothetical protein